MYMWVFVVFWLRLISEDVVSAAQICYNCGIGSECSANFNVIISVARYSECWDHCKNAVNCNVATLDETSNCTLYTCSQISQRTGGKVYRKTSITDCQEFELYKQTGYEGKCTVISTESNANSSDFCVERCLETPLCRGITYDEATAVCYIQNSDCSAVVTSTSKTYIQRKCFNEQPACVRRHMQTCVNCRAGYLCQTNFYQALELKPLNINTSVIGVDPDVGQIWYISSGSSYMHIQCSHVTQAIGDTVYRATCTQDCPRFEILTLYGHRGTCPELDSLSGGVTIEFCLDKCLDMEHCRGVSFDVNMLSCTFHTCASYTSSNGHHYIVRRCMNDTECDSASKTIQTCFGCSQGPNCPSTYESNGEYKLITDCLDIKDSDDDSIIVHYKRNANKCDRYQCSQVQQYIGHIVYRDSCNSDCPKFEIFQLENYSGSCDIFHSEEGGLTLHYCIEKCLDLTGCRGTTYNSLTGKCDYHDCSNHNVSSGLTFMWKRCIGHEPARDNQQICEGCTESSSCQGSVSILTSVLTWEDCKTSFSNSTTSGMIKYNVHSGRCDLYDCSLIQHQVYMSITVFRNSPSSDCPIYRLFILYGFVGTCEVIGFDEGGVDLDYCVDKCLDTDGCRSVSHDSSQMKCSYHNCLERDVNAAYTFVKRICLSNQEFNPVKPYTQTIKNYVNKCGSLLPAQVNQKIAYNCNTTCDECDNVVYDPLAEECQQYQCDRPFGLGQGLTMFRKTINPDCLNFELLGRAGSIPNCEAFDYDEGVANVEFCLRRCFDLTGCLALIIDVAGRNCTYHTCTDYTLESTLKLLVTKTCLPECPSPTTQTCLNCQQGSLCQSFFHNTTTLDGRTCQAECETESFCEGALYNRSNMACNMFQCSYVTQGYGSTFYRTSCNTDCPVYEMYILGGYSGTCEIITSLSEYFVVYPEICYNRCLDTTGCRGVTYLPSKFECHYHSCDCHAPFTALPGVIFMWKYCLEGTSNATVLPQTNSSSALCVDIYPTSPECKPDPIFIMPCHCSTGAFANLTTEEIVQQLVENLTIDADTTSASIRKRTSAEDNRPSSLAVGTVGVVILASVAAALVAVDIPNVITALKNIFNQKNNLIKPSKTRVKRPCTNDSIQSLDHLYAEDVNNKNESQTE